LITYEKSLDYKKIATDYELADVLNEVGYKLKLQALANKFLRKLSATRIAIPVNRIARLYLSPWMILH
jgi:hypothetical protein